MGYEIDAINAIIDERKSAEARARDHKIIKQHGGDRASPTNQVDYVILKHDGGNNADYLTARIARDRPDILDRMKAGEFTSVRVAAKGWSSLYYQLDHRLYGGS